MFKLLMNSFLLYKISHFQKSTTASESGSVSPGRSFSPNSIEIERKDQLRDLRKSYHAGDNVSQTSAVVAEKNRHIFVHPTLASNLAKLKNVCFRAAFLQIF